MPEHLQTAPNAINEAGQHSVNNYMVKSWRIVNEMNRIVDEMNVWI
jgi:hypothetical protein